MTKKASALAVAALVSLAATIATASVGYNKIDLPAESDVVISVPFTKVAVGEYTVSSKGGGTTLNLDGSPGFTANDFQGTHYIRVKDGPAAGVWSTISANASASVDLENSDVFAAMTGSETICIYPHMTLGELLPASLNGFSFEEGQINVLFFENSPAAPDTNKPAAGVASFNATFDFWTGGPNSAGASEIVTPDTRLGIRNNSTNATLSVFTMGQVSEAPIAWVLPSHGSQADLQVGSGLPVGITLAETDLGGNGNGVLFFDNTRTGTNLPSSSVANFNANFDFWTGGPGSAGGNSVIPASGAITVRAPAGSGGTVISVPNPFAD